MSTNTSHPNLATFLEVRTMHLAARRHSSALAVSVALLSTILFALCASAQDALWTFGDHPGTAATDAVHGIAATLAGNVRPAPGVAGSGALRFDGYTSSMSVAAASSPAPGTNGLTVELWLAPDAYPWNSLPLVEQQLFHQAGYSLGMDAFGHVALAASVNGQWQTAISTATLPLKRWSHLAGVVRHDGSGIALLVYLNGNEVARTKVPGELSPAPRADLCVGRVAAPTLPFPEAEIRPHEPILYSFDGLLSRLAFYAHPLSPADLAAHYTGANAPAGDVLPWPTLPSGPPGTGRFGAFYTTLHYQDTWDALRQIGPDADVVVRFEQSPVRLVFWQGTNYIPAWVSENGIWSTDEFLEVYDNGCPDGGDCEPMSDKQARFSHVDILESNSARAVIHWRYALVEAVNLKPAWFDPLTGASDWADEYWTVYPDAVAIRKQVLHSTHPGNVHEWQETIILHQPGRRPEDDIADTAVTLGNLRGETKSYSWTPKHDAAFTNPVGPADTSTPPEANMQLVGTKAAWKPFEIVPAAGVSSDFYNNERSYFEFECWNHWPVAQIASSDRACTAADRASHSSLSHLFWNSDSQTSNSATKLVMDGLTDRPLAQLVPLAKSWLHPAPFRVTDAGFTFAGYDRSERAYVVDARAPARTPLKLQLDVTPDSPLSNTAILIRNWGDAPARVRLNSRPLTAGKDLCIEHLHHLEGTDLLLWLCIAATESLTVEVIPGTQR